MRIHAASLRSVEVSNAAGRAARFLELGFDRLVLEAPFSSADWDATRALLPRGAVAALRLFAPYPRNVPQGRVAAFSLATSDRDDRREARKVAICTLEAADRCGIPYVLVPQVALEIPPVPKHASALPPALLARFDAERSAAVRPRLDALLSELARLVDLAAGYKLVLALTPAGCREDLLGREEVERCLKEFSGAPLGLWLDSASLPETPIASGASILGASLHDVRGPLRGLVPGDGELDWGDVAATLASCPLLALDLRPQAAESEIVRGREFLDHFGRPRPAPGVLVVPR